jgi:hypothetical protein
MQSLVHTTPCASMFEPSPKTDCSAPAILPSLVPGPGREGAGCVREGDRAHEVVSVDDRQGAHLVAGHGVDDLGGAKMHDKSNCSH